ncbi:hypothetical protein D3C87_410640 [compost metagenome]
MQQILDSRTSKNYSIFLVLAPCITYFLVNLFWLLPPTPPSDPLQYAAPALSPELGFLYLDRLGLWLWLRFFASLSIEPFYVAEIGTLTNTTLILLFGATWLTVRFGSLAAALFSFLFILSPLSLGIASYTYPMQLMTLVLLITVILLSETRKTALPAIGGIGFGIALLCKIQAFSFSFFLFLEILKDNKTVQKKMKSLFTLAIFTAIGVALVFGAIYALDGAKSIKFVISEYFNGTNERQLKGRALGDIPPFYKLLIEPSGFIAFLGFFIPYFIDRDKRILRLSQVATIQAAGILLIYLITQRGGPLITNYWYDTFIFGILSFSAAAPRWIKRHASSLIPFEKNLPLFFVSLSTMSLLSAAAEYRYGWKGLPETLLTLVLLASVFLILRKMPFNRKITSCSIFSVLIIIAIAYSTKDSVAQIASKIAFSTPFHEAARLLTTLPEERKVWINLQFERPASEDPSWRTEDLYFQVYKKNPPKNTNKVFSKKEPQEFDILVTDSYELAKQFNSHIMLKPRTVWILDRTTNTFSTKDY